MGSAIAFFVLLVILAIIKWGKGFVANVAVLLGIVAGAILAAMLGKMHFDKVADSTVVRHCLSVPFRDCRISISSVHHHVPGDDRGDDRVRSACSLRSAK